MSCNGCRVLRKGCSESCILRPCLQWIESPESQGHATVFVAKFFGRAGLMSFISGVPEKQRPALFQSLLFEACGRTVNPVNGAVGLLWTGNWNICQAAVETVLRGGTLQPMTEALGGMLLPAPEEVSEVQDPYFRSKAMKRKEINIPPYNSDLELSLTSAATTCPRKAFRNGKQRSTSPSEGSSVTTTTFDSGMLRRDDGAQKLLNLFV